MKFKFDIDINCNPWLDKMTGNLNFQIKNNAFDDIKAYLVNETI